MKNRYIIMRLKILLLITIKGKASIKKMVNALHCFLAYSLRLRKSAKYPFMINFELCNECNLRCLYCRNAEGDLYDNNPDSKKTLPGGRMPYETFAGIIDQVQGHILMAVLYITGEPLLYKDLFRAIRYASERNVATIISTNGVLLNKKNIMELLNSGLDFIKIPLSGFSQKVYGIEQKKGDVELVKENLRMLARLNKEGKRGLIIVMDYILYKHSSHELAAAKRFCNDLGIIFNVRQGNLRGLEDAQPVPESGVVVPQKSVCDWPWKALTVNWDGGLFPCCDYIMWGDSKPYTKLEKGKSSISDIWNGEEVIKYRIMHIKEGHRATPVCTKCTRRGTAFKY